MKLVNPANRRRYKVIVVGSGLAGGSAAATLGELGYNVECFCFQDSPRRAHSIAAQGGINAAKNYQNDGDSAYRLFYDTIKGGDFRSREANVYRLAQLSAGIIDQCVAMGVPFAREYGGQLNRHEAQGDENAAPGAEPLDEGITGGAAQPQGLEQARHAMAQVQAEKNHRSEIDARHRRVPEPQHHHPVDVVAALRVEQPRELGIHGEQREVQQVIDGEGQHEGAREDDGAARVGDRAGRGHGVAFGPRRAVQPPEAKRRADVDEKDGQQAGPRQPQEDAQVLETLRVGVRRLGAGEHQEIAGEVGDDEQNQQDARRRHDDFRADG